MRELEPIPQEEFKAVQYGLITPEGELYQCNYAGHSNLAWFLSEQGKLKRDIRNHYGSVHVSDAEFDEIYEGYTVTQAQLDTMFDYAIQHGITFDASILRVK